MTQDWFNMVSLSGLGWRTSKEMTYDIAMLALQRGIPGDFCECGVYAGASVALMARAIIDFWNHDERGCEYRAEPASPQNAIALSKRRVHLFDSFQGLPEPGLHDQDMVKGGASCPMADVQRNMKDWGIPEELLQYYPGWFEDTILPFAFCMAARNGSIAVLRIDGDLYSSTKTVMEHLYPLVSPGGYIIVDDFNLPGCQKAVLETVVPGPIYFRKSERG